MKELTKSLSLDELNLLHTKMCRVVGDPKRIQILYALAESPLSVGALTELLESPQPTISRHLAVLRESGRRFCKLRWKVPPSFTDWPCQTLLTLLIQSASSSER